VIERKIISFCSDGQENSLVHALYFGAQVWRIFANALLRLVCGQGKPLLTKIKINIWTIQPKPCMQMCEKI